MDKLSLPSKQRSQRDLTANQFQEKLYYWFQEQGLLSELRGHLRMHMVNALQDSGKPPTGFNKYSISPKNQALSILLADFLLHQGFNYTLSVYVTEVPVIGQMFSQFSQPNVRKALENGNLLCQRFTVRDVEDILETLGLNPGSELCNRALSLYHDSSVDSQNSSESFLMCLIRALTTHQRKDMVSEALKNGKSVHSIGFLPENAPEEKMGSSDEWMKTMEDIMLQNNMKISHINYLQECMKKVHEEELWKVREEEAAKYRKMMGDRLKEYEEKDRRERQVAEWKNTVEADLMQREKNLCKLAAQLRGQHQEISDKLLYLEMESEQVRHKERQIKEEQERRDRELTEQKSEVDVHQEKINKAYERLAADQKVMEKMKEELVAKGCGNGEDYLVLRADVESTRSVDFLKQVRDQYATLAQMISSAQALPVVGMKAGKSCEEHSHVEVPTEDKALQTTAAPTDSVLLEAEVLSRIEEEKEELREHVSQQRRRIEELTVRAADLANQLQDAQVALHLINTDRNQMAVTLPPLPAASPWPPQVGSGEQPNFFRGAPPSTLNQRPQGPASRRRATRRNLSYGAGWPLVASESSNHSESSNTEELIQEARARLRLMEDETSTVNHGYERFRTREAREPSWTVFHPERSTARNVFDGLRTTASRFAAFSPLRHQAKENTRNFASRISDLVSRAPFDADRYGRASGYRPVSRLRGHLRSDEEEDEEEEETVDRLTSLRRERQRLFSKDKRITVSEYSRRLLDKSTASSQESEKKESKLQFSKTVTIVGEETVDNDRNLNVPECEDKPDSPRELQDLNGSNDLSVQVLLQRSIKTSSSSDPPSLCSQVFQNHENPESERNRSDDGEAGRFTSKSLPNRSTTSFFAREETCQVSEVPLGDSDSEAEGGKQRDEKKDPSMVPLLNFSSTSIGVNTSRDRLLDPVSRREPGDGTDEARSDTDDQLSVGTQESSSPSVWST